MIDSEEEKGLIREIIIEAEHGFLFFNLNMKILLE